MRITIRLGHEWTFEELAPGTIALDGAVPGPRIDPETRRYSFDHHAGCLRLVTTATCQQVLDAVLMGLDPTGTEVLLNDLDGDTVLSVWLLRQHEACRRSDYLALVRRLVWTVAALDAHGPAYPVPDPALSSAFHRRILIPLGDRRLWGYPAGTTHALDAAQTALDEWWADGFRASEPLPCRGEEPAVTVYKGWVFAKAPPEVMNVRVLGADWLYGQGHDRLVLCTPLREGLYRYTLAKRSDLVAGFPLPALYERLNLEESRVRGRPLAPGETWGGSSSVGGGPRQGSHLTPEIVKAIIDTVLEETSSPRTGQAKG